MQNALSLNRGQIVSTTSIVNKLGGGFNATFKAPKGKRFAFIYIGLEDDENPIEPTVVLNDMGWHQMASKPAKMTKNKKKTKN